MDQFGQGKEIPIDYNSDPDTCSVRLVLAWIEFQQDHPEVSLFPTAAGLYISTFTVSGIMKDMTAAAGLVGKFSGHSLCIGGVTAAVKGGMLLAIIRSIKG